MAKTLSSLLQEHAEEIVAAWAGAVRQSSEHYRTRSLDELKSTVGQFFNIIVDGVDDRWDKLLAFARQIGELRVGLEFNLPEILNSVSLSKDFISPILEQEYKGNVSILVGSLKRVDIAVNRFTLEFSRLYQRLVVTQMEQKTAELVRSEERRRGFMDSAVDGFSLLDSELNYVEANESLLSIFPTGIKKEDLMGKNIAELAPDIKETGRYDQYMDVIKTGNPFSADDVAPHPKFGDKHLAMRAFKAGDGLGIIFTDVTELKQATEELSKHRDHLEKLVEERTAEITKQSELIQRQAKEILEVSTPVMQLWEGVIVAPLIGTLDSQRTQQFMDKLLQQIVETNSPVALVDITGVSTIDTQTAQHLIDTISAVRLLGAQVILTGVRPSIAQTLVHLGIDLSNVTTRPSLVAGLVVALDSLGLQVTTSRRADEKVA